MDMIQYQLERLRIINLIFLLCYNDIEMGNNMKKTIIVNEDSDIITYLKKYDMAKNKIKTYIKLGFIYVNDKKIKLPYKLNAGDIINIIRNDFYKKLLRPYFRQVVYIQADDCRLFADSTNGSYPILAAPACLSR